MASTPLPRYPLGKNGPQVPAIGFGLMGMFYPIYGAVPSKDKQFALLDRAVEIGATFWDTADLYGNSEEVLGEWFRRTGKRDEIFLATKFGHVKGRPDFAADSSADYCKQACEASLKTLGVASIDLYYLHAANPETPIEETMRALAQLQAEGKIKHIGLSNVSSTTLRRAHRVAPVAAVQGEYSVTERGIEGRAGTDLLAVCRALGVAVVCETPLARGLLSAAFAASAASAADARAQALPRFQAANRGPNAAAVAPFRALADRRGCSVSQLALAWLLKQGRDIFPIPGTKTIKYLEENCAAAGIHLSDEDEAEIRALAEQTQIVGGTVPEQFADHLFRDTKPEITPTGE